jgi:hypothetical protein
LPDGEGRERRREGGREGERDGRREGRWKLLWLSITIITLSMSLK